ncbi:MAG TPA: response regulator, partial [Candidatus Limnocylindria bacterium]|nr:response regulator [Candidatus Limnocylindria bacterium]
MKSHLRILHLEDDPNDASLLQTMLRTAGFTCQTTRVETRSDFVAALEREEVDLIMADFGLPKFDGLSALEIVRVKWPDLPFILVSGSVGEEFAIEALKSGATDYVLKDHLSRLVPAVRRALQEVDDRAQRKQLEHQFVQSQKMEVVGQLAGGIAHDFNNILAVIMGYSDMMMQTLGPDDPMRKDAGEIRHAAERAAALTRQLLVFSRKEILQPVVLDLNDVVRNIEKMLRQLIDENIVLSIVPGKEIGRVKADAGYVGQVLMNLVVNARDAMPPGGRLSIETGQIKLDENDARTHTGIITAGNYVTLSISDTGTGMTDKVKARLFEPLFTTKPKGKGTGLGLTTCQTIVHESGGHIVVNSELGKGTTFQVYFPRVDQPLDGSARTDRIGPMPRGTERLLVVEDEPAVRQLARMVLEAQGYEVLCASNGEDGLRVAREQKGTPIRLVITDVIMPQMDGHVMAASLKSAYPELKILFTSGYNDDVIAHHGVLNPEVAFLPKPYTPSTL